jgi:dihydropyrimidinase
MCGYWEGAKHVCAPPLRHSDDDLQCVWDEVANGTVNLISSDYTASKCQHEDGKQRPLHQAQASGGTPEFNQILIGLPGLETRLPLLFHAATSSEVDKRRRLPLPRFVAQTSTNPARIYGLKHCAGL